MMNMPTIIFFAEQFFIRLLNLFVSYVFVMFIPPLLDANPLFLAVASPFF